MENPLLTRRVYRQLTKLPANAGRKFARACVDSPSEAETYQTKLRDGDIVIAYARRVIFSYGLLIIDFSCSD